MKRIGFFAGSFDPFTKGHLAVVIKALVLFDEIIIGIAYNPEKPNRRFNAKIIEQAVREMLIQENLSSKCQVISYAAPILTWKQAQDMGATHLIRGLRDNIDYGYEEKLAKANKKLGNFETVYFRSDTDIDYISSTIIMECWLGGMDVSEYIPAPVLDAMNKCR